MGRLLWLVTVLLAFAIEEAQGKSNNGCDYFEGRWEEEESYPLYSERSCPFIGFKCINNGRPDTHYLKFRWKPNACNLPRFDGGDLLEKYRGKKIMFVGDSLSNNMWQSLTCLLYTATTPHSNYTLTTSGLLNTFSLPEYGISIMFLKNGFLVDMVKEKIGKVLKLDSINSADQWKGVDMLIFNTFHWWTHSGKSKTWDYFGVGKMRVVEMDRMEAFRIALSTWANWVNANVNPALTKVFYQGISAVHVDGQEWGSPRARSCKGQREPIEGPHFPGPPIPGEAIVKAVLGSLGSKAYLLDLALLTQLRRDAHPSVYAGQGPGFVDCSHWCLPGVPDTWNEILYAALLDNS